MSSILKMPLPLPIPAPSQSLSFSTSLLPLHTNLSFLSLQTHTHTRPDTTIRMGGGPRTYPGGVSKWQWKRMQAKKAKQLLKARLARERHIYEMRKRAELQAAVSDLERPWEAVDKAPNLFSVSADEQLKVLADRFQKPGGFDMWSDRDGPQLFETVDELPSARFFPKGVVHSVKPYLRNRESDESSKLLSENKREEAEPEPEPERNGKKNGVKWRRKGIRRNLDAGGKTSNLKSGFYDKRSNFKSEVYDMSLQRDGSYGINKRND